MPRLAEGPHESGWFRLPGRRLALFHHLTAAFFFLCLATSLPMFVPVVAAWAGHRELYRETHVITGLLALVVGAASLTRLAGPGARERRAAITAWTGTDAAWMRQWRRSLARPAFPQPGPNPGQRVAASAMAASMVALAASGLVLRFFSVFPLWMRTGASLVHNLFFYLLTAIVLVHIVYALITFFQSAPATEADPQQAEQGL